MNHRVLDYHKVVEVSNDLTLLIEVGTLNFHSFPSKDFGLQAVTADSDGWKWLDGDFFKACYPRSFHPTFEALIYLLRYRFVTATFKVFHVTLGFPMDLCKVRVYALPLDVQGARYVQLWRRQWLEQHLARRSRSEWLTLLRVLDFSAESWAGPTALHCSLIDYVGSSSVVIFPLVLTDVYFESFEHNSSFHFDRWLDRKSYYVPTRTPVEDTLESVISRMYNRISVPDLTHYNMKVARKLKMSPTEELIASLILEYPAKEVPGVRSRLYPFQLMSLCKMIEQENSVKKEVVPFFKQMTSPTGRSYYFNMLDSGFYRQPELYDSPKGGILAENMGLGKTLICLSLICITKYDISVIPDDVILYHDQTLSSGIRSLFEICRDTIGKESLPWRYYQNDFSQAIVEKLSLSPGFFRVSLDHSPNQWGLRKEKRQQSLYQTLYLCNTTLLIVPENLFHQWNHEFAKHIEPSYLSKLFVSNRFKHAIHNQFASYVDDIPDTVNELIKYDVVLLTAALFAKIFRDDQNILKNIYWKRLIIDEGHSMNSKSSNLSQLCSSLSAECRWAVTGTPTSGLTNLYMDEEENVTDSPKKKRKYVVKSKFNVRDDMVKLGHLVGSFFRIEPFHSQPKLWNSAIVRNLADSTFSTEASLQKLLDLLMVRHGLSDVEEDLKLPQLHHEAVFISPSYHNKLAINLFTAVLAVNAVSSEREGVDYMFDPSNRQQLRRLVNNLQLATFYWTGFQSDDVSTLLDIAKHCMEKRNPQGELVHGENDQRLLRLSCEAAKEAIRNPRWRTASMLHEMEYFVRGLPRSFVRSFGIGVLENGGVFGAPQLAAVQDFYYKNRFLDMSDEEKLQTRLDNAARPFWERYWNDSKGTKFKNQSEFDSVNESSKKNASKWKDAKDTLSREDGSLRVTNEVEYVKTEDIGTDAAVSVRRAQILGSASAKLSYLASRLVDHHQQNIKSIVFFEFEDSAYYLTELLDILGVPYILYATFIGAGQRSNNLADFDSHDAERHGGITLIMDLRLASHGLTIISATRVYFISPVWQRSVEAQAIKRAHRIGQTQEVFVETLVLKGTLEEEIYRRRETESLTEESDSARRYVIDDTGMQQFILRHEFLSTQKGEKEYAEFESMDDEANNRVSHSTADSAGMEVENKDEILRADITPRDELEKILKFSDQKNTLDSTDAHNVDTVSMKMDHVKLKSDQNHRTNMDTKNVEFHSEAEKMVLDFDMNNLSVPTDSISDSSLLRHQSRSEHDLHWVKRWKMYLFNPDNIEKLSAAKKQKASIDELNSDLVEGKVEAPPRPVHVVHRKRVRF